MQYQVDREKKVFPIKHFVRGFHKKIMMKLILGKVIFYPKMI